MAFSPPVEEGVGIGLPIRQHKERVLNWAEFFHREIGEHIGPKGVCSFVIPTPIADQA